jgi:hypothetical protein
MTDPDVNGMRRVHRRVGRDTSVAAIGPMGHAHFSLDPTVEDMEAVLYFAKQVQAEDRSNRQLATLNAVVRELLSERDNAGYVPDGLCVAIGWPDPIMLVSLSTKAKP